MRKEYSTDTEACFVCSNIYQVIQAVIYAKHVKSADLYVFGMFSGYEKVCEQIRSLCIFRRVFAVDCAEFGAPGRWKGLKQMLFSEQTVGVFLPKDACYKTFYTSNRAHVKTVMLHVLKKRNNDIRVVFFEDGLGTYSKDSHILKTTSIRRRAENLLGWKLYQPEKMFYLVNLPELFTKPDGYEMCQVIKFPTDEILNEENTEILNFIFDIRMEDTIYENVLIFDTLRFPGLEKEPDINKLDKCYEVAVKEFGYENVICKPHPRSRKTTEINIKTYDRCSVPAELLYNNMDHIDSKVIITYNSSAAFTPKMLYNKEPNIIFLYRLTDSNKEHIAVNDEIAEKIISTYKDKSKVSVPCTMEEYQSVLHACRKADR